VDVFADGGRLAAALARIIRSTSVGLFGGVLKEAMDEAMTGATVGTRVMVGARVGVADMFGDNAAAGTGPDVVDDWRMDCRRNFTASGPVVGCRTAAVGGGGGGGDLLGADVCGEGLG